MPPPTSKAPITLPLTMESTSSSSLVQGREELSGKGLQRCGLLGVQTQSATVVPREAWGHVRTSGLRVQALPPVSGKHGPSLASDVGS